MTTTNNDSVYLKSFEKINNDIKKTYDEVNFNFEFFDKNIFFKQANDNEALVVSNNEAYVFDKFFKLNNKRHTLFKIDDNILTKKFCQEFIDFLNPPLSSVFGTHVKSKRGFNSSDFYVLCSKDFIINFGYRNIYIIFDDENEKYMNEIIPDIVSLVNNYSTIEYKNKMKIVYKDNIFYTKEFEVKNYDINLNLHYNDDFKDISKDIIVKLNNENGLVILNGEPGTGKTSYLRYLVSKLKKDIIFLAPGMIEYLTDPAFIPFLMKQSNSILIIEEGESVLSKRDLGNHSNGISNILNMTDGLLSDCLNISIIVTFNTDLNNIDEALLRKGRLLKNYTFEKLSIEKSKKLGKKLKLKNEINEELSLAEIYNYNEDLNLNEKTYIPMGF